MKRIIFFICVLMLTLSADEKPLGVKAEFGYIQTGGNTNTEALNFELDAKKNWDKHSLKFEADAQYANSDGKENSNRITSELSYGYDYSDIFTYGYLVGYKQDKFSGYDYQFYTGPNIWYKMIDTNVEHLSFEFALLYAKDKLEDEPADRYLSSRARVMYDRKILDNLKFEEDFSYRTSLKDFENFFIVSKTSLVNKLTDIISAGISYRIDYAGVVLDDKKKQDTTFMVNLILSYNSF